MKPQDSRSFKRTAKENFWEPSFSEFLVNINSYIHKILTDTDIFFGSVSFLEIIKLLRILTDPFNFYKPRGVRTQESVSNVEKAFQEVYVKYSSYYIVNLMQHLILSMEKRVGYIDEEDLVQLDEYLGSQPI